MDPDSVKPSLTLGLFRLSLVMIFALAMWYALWRAVSWFLGVRW